MTDPRRTKVMVPWWGILTYLVFCFTSSAAGMVLGLFVHDWITK